MAASRSKRSVKQKLNPDFEYQFPDIEFPSEAERNATPSVAAIRAAMVTTPNANKKKSEKSSRIKEQLELEQLKHQNLQLELQVLSKKEKISAESTSFMQDDNNAATAALLKFHRKNPCVAHE
ncbi:hypothetical protein OS493_014627 [Desmophyllum pertusum]|uniref:Uncharacterized protein n=1 Tax=Desmophyllum pertusum TaxID=174260 RepID=A0A9W9YPU6_9CNID|nr:hypothetical protein OS493_014627 [Desmophyllum pertusum]